MFVNYGVFVIKDFADKDTELLFNGGNPKRFSQIKRQAERKLQLLDSAVTLDFLRSPPGNCLEMLSGNREGQYSIRINKQYRLCFFWSDGNASRVEIADYH